MNGSEFWLRPLAALALLLGFWLLASLARRLPQRLAARLDHERAYVADTLGSTSYVVLLAIGSISALGTLGINISALVAGLGLTGFALGFALKDALANTLAGVLLLVYRPFRRGDRISVLDFEGTVRGIDLRYITLESGSDKTVLLPNQMVFSNPIVLLPPAADQAPPQSEAELP